MTAQPNHSWGAPMAGLFLGAFVSTLATTIANVSVPTLMTAFNATAHEVQWVVTIFMLTTGLAVPLAGWLMDRFGQKNVYIASLALFTAASAACALAPTLPFLVAARVAQGIGAGIMSPVTMAMIYRIVPREQVGTAMGLWAVASMAAPAIGPTLGGYLLQYGGWPVVFWLNVPACLPALYLAARTLPGGGQVAEGSRFDRAGFISVTVGLFALQLALASGRTTGWTSPVILVLLATSLIALLAFTWVELREKVPLLDLRVLRYPAFRASLTTIFAVVLGLNTGIFYLPILLQNEMGMTPVQVGLLLLPTAITSAILQPISGRIFDKVGPKVVVLVGIIALGVTNLLLARVSAQTSVEMIILINVLRGAGVGLSFMPTVASGMNAVAQREIGRASSLSNIVQRVGGSLGLAAMTTLLDGRESVHLANGAATSAAFLRGMNDMFLVAGVLTLMAVFPALRLARSSGVESSRERSPAAGD